MMTTWLAEYLNDLGTVNIASKHESLLEELSMEEDHNSGRSGLYFRSNNGRQ
jgi:hypothetical protein